MLVRDEGDIDGTWEPAYRELEAHAQKLLRHAGGAQPTDGRAGEGGWRFFYSAVVLRGRCACNAVGYEVADEFVVAYNCHCSNCRAMTGSAFLPWGEIEPEKLRVTNGTDSLLVDGDAAAAHAMRCGQCWSLLYWTVHHHDRMWLRVPYGSLTDEPTLKPTAHMFVGSKAGWYEILDDLPQHDEYPWS